MNIPSEIDLAGLERSLSRFKFSVTLEDLESQCDNESLRHLFENLVDLALRYTESVCRFQRIVIQYQGSFDEHGMRQDIESVRGSNHDAFIDAVNILSRALARNGKSTAWRNTMLDDRSALGRFALVIAFQYIQREQRNGQKGGEYEL